MKKIIHIIIFSVFILLMGSCTKNFEDINIDPNKPSVAPIENVFANVIQDISERFGTTEMETAASYVGHITKGTYTEVTTYQGSPSSSIWNGSYRSTLSNANFVIKQAEIEGNINMQAATLVLRAYAMQMVTDIYGQVPYSEAGQGADGIINPLIPSVRRHENPSDFKIKAGQSFTLPQRRKVTFSPPYGIEVFKVFASYQPINLSPIITSRGEPKGTKLVSPLESLFQQSYKMSRGADIGTLSADTDAATFSYVFKISPK